MSVRVETWTPGVARLTVGALAALLSDYIKFEQKRQAFFKTFP